MRMKPTWTAAAARALAIFAVIIAPQVKTDEGTEGAAAGEGGGAEGPERLPRTRVVRTKYGQVQGRVVSLDSGMLKDVGRVRLQDVEIYQGIRYATPPVGNHR